MRRKKDAHELKLMKKAVEITLGAHKHISKIISPNLHEYEIQAEVESFFIKNGAKVAFPSIVASGENTTVLHYTSLDKKLDGMLVVDIGARFNYYCADITRTYSVGGKFSSREKEIYDTVFELKKYVAKIAKPGFFLRNKEEPEKSLHHIAENFLRERGLLKYFVHGIGHFLGLDVHDVGDTKIPLGSGDVFTIEPGIYIKEERIGVRIEDDFVITESGCNVL